LPPVESDRPSQNRGSHHRSRSQFSRLVEDPRDRVNIRQTDTPPPASSSPRETEVEKDVKVSPHGTSDALFKECLDRIRQQRFEADPDFDTGGSPVIDKLTADEMEITRKLFQRIDPDREVAPRLEHKDRYIDPYWDPFAKVEEMRDQLATDFNDYVKLLSAAEARKEKLKLRKTLKDKYPYFNPYSKPSQERYKREQQPEFPYPHHNHERFWNPPPDTRTLLKNRGRMITWRDLDVLHHFVADNGYILPRRITMATRRQQRAIFNAISMARRLAIMPYDWKPSASERMPVMDPLQYIAEEMTDRYIERRDRRALAILKVMERRYPSLEFKRLHKFLRAQEQREDAEAVQKAEEEAGDFSRLLSRYTRLQQDRGPSWETGETAPYSYSPSATS